MSKIEDVIEGRIPFSIGPDGSVKVAGRSFTKPIKTAIPGLYFKSFSLDRLHTINLISNYKEKAYFLFKNVVCDKEGKTFSGVQENYQIDMFPAVFVSDVMNQFYQINWGNKYI